MTVVECLSKDHRSLRFKPLPWLSAETVGSSSTFWYSYTTSISTSYESESKTINWSQINARQAAGGSVEYTHKNYSAVFVIFIRMWFVTRLDWVTHIDQWTLQLLLLQLPHNSLYSGTKVYESCDFHPKQTVFCSLIFALFSTSLLWKTGYINALQNKTFFPYFSLSLYPALVTGYYKNATLSFFKVKSFGIISCVWTCLHPSHLMIQPDLQVGYLQRKSALWYPTS